MASPISILSHISDLPTPCIVVKDILVKDCLNIFAEFDTEFDTELVNFVSPQNIHKI